MPVRGFIGQLEEHVLSAMHKVYLWTHMHFHLEYNGKQVRCLTTAEEHAMSRPGFYFKPNPLSSSLPPTRLCP
jgi:hypothetical protein